MSNGRPLLHLQDRSHGAGRLQLTHLDDGAFGINCITNGKLYVIWSVLCYCKLVFALAIRSQSKSPSKSFFRVPDAFFAEELSISSHLYVRLHYKAWLTLRFGLL